MIFNKDELIWTKMTKDRKTESQKHKKTERQKNGKAKWQKDRKRNKGNDRKDRIIDWQKVHVIRLDKDE